MSATIPLHEVARLPLPGDNVAIATQRLDAGNRLALPDGEANIDFTLLEGHRFAIRSIPAGSALLSWGLPFGYADRDISPGTYVVNRSTLEALTGRSIDFTLPAAANFVDQIRPYELDAAALRPAEQVERHREIRSFWGYRRRDGRGVGTRNTIVLLGISSRAAGFVRRLEQRLRGDAAEYANIDAIVAVAHTEGADPAPNNRELVLRTLAGFMTHPNVGAVLAVGVPGDAITVDDLSAYTAEHRYPLAGIPHAYMLLDTAFETKLDEATTFIRDWYPAVDCTERTSNPLSELKIALQCGGSDAFSGVSGNPLAAWVAKEVIKYGGSANLAETDELIGAESYVLQKVRDLETARKFLDTVERFKAWTVRHGTSAEGNPSGGNKYRGLYNITLKSIGAAMKRDPEVRLDYVIDYGQPMTAPGYYFMDSPGNDLESIAGQVASGCNMIFFVTGNGSITNFPFVPTLKIVTTTERYRLLSRDMDVNAGLYLDGMPMDELGSETLDLTARVASGERSVGERAGHAQVQIWRNWQRDEGMPPPPLSDPTTLRNGLPLPLHFSDDPDPAIADLRIDTAAVPDGSSGRPVGLILPTSLCAGQVAEMAARRLNRRPLPDRSGIEKFVALVHTEGCGCSPAVKEITTDVLLGYLRHPRVRRALLLEHGCEITHNDHMRLALAKLGLRTGDFGWASIQLDGGIANVLEKVDGWFDEPDDAPTPTIDGGALTAHSLALWTDAPPSADCAQMLAYLAGQLVTAGGTVVVPDKALLLKSDRFRTALGIAAVEPTLAYGQPPLVPGFHVMETPTAHWVETLVGLGASGVEAVLVSVAGRPLEGHPLVDVVQVTSSSDTVARYAGDLDLVLSGAPADMAVQAAVLLAAVLDGSLQTAVQRTGNVDFQLTRGLVGISM